MKNRNRRDELLRRLGVDKAAVDGSAQITPLLRQVGVQPARVIEVLRVDEAPESRAVVALWDTLTPASRNLLGLEALALAADLTPRRLWELYSGAGMEQTRACVAVQIAESLPEIMRTAIKAATERVPILDNERRLVGYANPDIKAQEMLFKAARVLPTPKGSTTNINVGPQGDAALPEVEDGSRGELEQADDFLIRASRAMGVKSLPAPAVDAEVIEGEIEGEDE